MDEYLDLVARVPLFGVSFIDDLRGVHAVADRVEELLG
jgi:hypothetical protein